MTGPEHYEMAETLLAGTQEKNFYGDVRTEPPTPESVAKAQVHATLALAAATATAGYMELQANGLAWDKAVGMVRR